MTSAELSAAFAAAGAAAWGGMSWTRAATLTGEREREKVGALCRNPRSVLVAAFPYFSGEAPGNLSLYARGEDYHRVLTRRLKTVCNFLSENYTEFSFLPGTDNSPLPEREIAWGCGLGLRGKNGLLILPPYGSYVFLGTILTDLSMEFSTLQGADVCASCGLCEKSCPAGALEGGIFHKERCLSEISQQKGELTAQESALLAKQECRWGCDLCQRCCPYNRDAACSPLGEFRNDLISTLTLRDLEGLTNRGFREKYGDRAFAWRGCAVLRRNLSLQKGENGEAD